MCLEGYKMITKSPKTIWVMNARSERNKDVKELLQAGYIVKFFDYDKEERCYFALMEESKETFNKRVESENEMISIDKEAEEAKMETNNQTAFTLVTKIAVAMNKGNKLEGIKTNYQADLKLAWKLYKEERLAEVNTLVTVETIQTLESLKAGKVSKVETVETAEKETITLETKTDFPAVTIPMNIMTQFGQTVFNTVETLVTQSIHGTMVGDKKINGWDVLQGEHRENKIMFAQDGLQSLASVNSFNELQAVMITYFLKDITMRMITKYAQMGLYYKKLDNRDINTLQTVFSYQNAPSSDETFTHAIEDIYHDLILSAYDKTFSEQMFEVPAYAFTSIYFRISNVIRKQRGKQTSRLVRALKANLVETYTEFEGTLFKQMDFLGEKEKEVMELIVVGYNLKEIDELKGQRTDRTVKSLRSKLESLSGKTIKEARQEQKELIAKQKKAEKDMRERIKEQMLKGENTSRSEKIIKRFIISEKKNIAFTGKTLNTVKNLEFNKNAGSTQYTHMVYQFEEIQNA